MSPNYEFRIPKALGYSIPVAVAGIMLATLVSYASPDGAMWGVLLAVLITIVSGAYVFIAQYIKYFTNLDRRLLARDFLLKEIDLKGNESILDIGCGNGILILGAAKKLTTGKAIGTDIWTENSGDNKKEIFEQNAKIEGVSEFVSLYNEDARNLSFKSDSFDSILCGLTMHHILHDEGVEKAIAEMSRVLKPSGSIAIYDVPIAIKATKKLLLKQGMIVKKINSNFILCRKIS